MFLQKRLAPDVNKILYVKNLPYQITTDELYELFGKYGAIRQIRVGNKANTKGTAFVVYEEILDAKNACEHLSGFNVGGRYLVVLYFNKERMAAKMDTEQKRAEIDALKKQHNL